MRTREHLLHHKSVNIDHAVLQEVQRQHAQLVILGPIAGQFTTPGKEDKIIRAVPMLNHVKAFMNLAAQSFFVQVSAEENGLDRFSEFGESLVGVAN